MSELPNKQLQPKNLRFAPVFRRVERYVHY